MVALSCNAIQPSIASESTIDFYMTILHESGDEPRLPRRVLSWKSFLTTVHNYLHHFIIQIRMV